jgi:hypothetical protein
MAAIERSQDTKDRDETFFRRFMMCEEERRIRCPETMTLNRHWCWFRSPNVVCLEKVRRLRTVTAAGGDPTNP